MTMKRAHQTKFHKIIELTSGTGVKGETLGYQTYGETDLRVSPVSVGGTNVIDVEGRLEGQTTWTVLGSVTGTTSDSVDISTYDYIRFNTTTADGTGEVIVSGFFNQTASSSSALVFKTMQTDAGTSPVADAIDDTLTLTSSDASITITGNSTTDTIDFTSSGGSGDVVGPASSTDNAAARFDTTTGVLLQDSKVTIDDIGRIGIDSTALGGSVFIGEGAGIVDDVSTNYNVGVGEDALKATTSGNKCVAIGAFAADANVAGFSIVAIGYQAGCGGSPSRSVFVGQTAGTSATLGNHAGVGHQALFGNTSGQRNCGLGYLSGGTNTTGNDNVAVGYFTGYGVAGANSNNVFLGAKCAGNVTTGSDNIIIGFDIDLPTATTGNYLNIGDLIEGDLTNGNLGLGSVDYGSGVGVMAIGNGTAPSGTPTGGGVLYVESGALKYKGSSGTVTTLGVA